MINLDSPNDGYVSVSAVSGKRADSNCNSTVAVNYDGLTCMLELVRLEGELHAVEKYAHANSRAVENKKTALRTRIDSLRTHPQLLLESKSTQTLFSAKAESATK